MEILNEYDRDKVLCKQYTVFLIKKKFGIDINPKYQSDLVKFNQFYWESIKGTGTYLKDVGFQDLMPDAQEKIIYRSFMLWRNYNVEQKRLV